MRRIVPGVTDSVDHLHRSESDQLDGKETESEVAATATEECGGERSKPTVKVKIEKLSVRLIRCTDGEFEDSFSFSRVWMRGCFLKPGSSLTLAVASSCGRSDVERTRCCSSTTFATEATPLSTTSVYLRKCSCLIRRVYSSATTTPSRRSVTIVQ